MSRVARLCRALRNSSPAADLQLHDKDAFTISMLLEKLWGIKSYVSQRCQQEQLESCGIKALGRSLLMAGRNDKPT